MKLVAQKFLNGVRASVLLTSIRYFTTTTLCASIRASSDNPHLWASAQLVPSLDFRFPHTARATFVMTDVFLNSSSIPLFLYVSTSRKIVPKLVVLFFVAVVLAA